MKIIKARLDLLLLFLSSFTLIAILSYFFFFHLLATIYQINWIFDILLLALICMPSAGLKLDEEKPKTPTGKWLLFLFFIQLILNLMFYNLPHVFLQPFNPKPTFNMNVFSAGVFPCGLIILLAITMRYFTYMKKSPGLLSSSYSALFNNHAKDSTGIVVDTYMRSVTTSCLMFSLWLFSLSVALLIQNLTQIKLISGLNPGMTLISFLLYLLTAQQGWVKFLHQLKSKKIPLMFIMFFFALLIGVVYSLLSYLINWLDIAYLKLNLIELNTKFVPDQLKVIITLWWWGFAIMAGGIIASISSFRSSREIIIATFLTNLLSWAVIVILEKTMHADNSILIESLLIFCQITILSLILHPSSFTYFSRATLPTHEAIKPRTSFSLLKTIPFTTTAFFSIYLMTSLTFFSFLTVFLLFIPALLTLISLFSWIKATFSLFAAPAL